MPSTGTISRLLHKAMAVVTLSSAVLSFAVILLSWLGSVLWRGDIVSLLTPRGMRWIVGSCADMLATDVVVWLLLRGLAYGVTVRSGWAEALFANASLLLTPKARRPAVAAATTYIERVSFRISVAVLLVMVAVVLLKNGKTGVKVLPRVAPRVVNYYNQVGSHSSVEEIKLFLSKDIFFNRFPNSSALNVIFVDHDEVMKHLVDAERLVCDGKSLTSK